MTNGLYHAILPPVKINYSKKPNCFICKGASDSKSTVKSGVSHLEAHAGFFRFLMRMIFDPYVL